MVKDVASIIIDLELLVSCSIEDFSKRFWNNYETYLNEYNKLLDELQDLGYFNELDYIQPVPSGQKAYGGVGFTQIEQAKLREITIASTGLERKAKLLLSSGDQENKEKPVKSNKIFVVHGHDEEMKLAVARKIEKLDFEPLILHEKPNKGRTIIEKFTDYADVSFAVVLLSPDDLAYPKDKTPDDAKYRARQNVIFELGYFLGKLGRKNVTVIYRKTTDFEIPNDYSGVLWIPFESGWEFDLVKELKACSFNVDANKLLN